MTEGGPGSSCAGHAKRIRNQFASISWSPTLTVLRLNLNNLYEKKGFILFFEGSDFQCATYSNPTNRKRMGSRQGKEVWREPLAELGLDFGVTETSVTLLGDIWKRENMAVAPVLQWSEDRVHWGAAAFLLHYSGNWIWRQLPRGTIWPRQRV